MNGLPGGGKGIQMITRHGKGFHAHMAGQKHPVDLGDPNVHVHLAPGAQFDPGDGGEMVDIHKAYHHAPQTLPPALMKMIMAAIQAYMEQQGMHEQMGQMGQQGAGMMDAGLPGGSGGGALAA